MQLTDFHYDLPQEQIAKYPMAERSASRMLHLCRRDGIIQDDVFTSLVELLSPNDLLIFNDTKVMQARLYAKKPTGGKVSLLVERVLSEYEALVHIKSNKSLRLPCVLLLEGGARLEVINKVDGLYQVNLFGDVDFYQIMASQGEMPLPPYIKRDIADMDTSRYQTLYAKRLGAVAAPTAGLHFDEATLGAIKQRGVECGYITLHVGAGTFQPVREGAIDDHVMHSEVVDVCERVCEQIRACRQRGGRVIAVGTTVVRSLETAALSGELQPFHGESNLFIREDFKFQGVDGMLTNFHLPSSTLLMLVSAFAGHGPVMKAYAHAVRHGYRFFSYGDAMLVV
jgi:S-adenosylmethionine:tRNA ribosyltransferase-isomerase